MSEYGFKQLDYEAIQHVPLLREAWVLSFRGSGIDDGHEGRTADPLLHAAVRRRRVVAARV